MKITSLSNEIPTVVDEAASLSRLNEKINDRQFIIATAWRDENSIEQNLKGNIRIKDFCNRHKMGVNYLTGHWKEAPRGMDYDEAKNLDLLIPVQEESLFIPKNDEISSKDFKHFAKDLCILCSQDSVLFKDVDGMYKYLYGESKEEDIGKNLTWKEVGDAYSILRGHEDNPFTFVS